MPRTRTPTARRVPCALAVATPISVEISWLGSPLRGAVRVVDWIASMRTCERSAPWRPSVSRAIALASSSTCSDSPITRRSIDSPICSGKRDMCTPLCAGSRSTVHSSCAA